MCEETAKIEEAVGQMLIGSRKCRTIEMQNCCWLSANYFQGTIDALTDVLTEINKIKAEAKRLNGGQEIE
jgi:hypothetical protein